jgi:hypothetical protein
MHLPIPHPDLMQLSQMHFPSYARALWRHHRDIKGAKGRLLLLILELYLTELVSDYGFLSMLVNEIGALRLPRTIFLASESIERYVDRNKTQTQAKLLEPLHPVLFPMLSNILKNILLDLKNIEVAKTNDGDSEYDVVLCRYATNTVVRFARVIMCFSDLSCGQDLLVDCCRNLIEFVQGKKWCSCLGDVIQELVRRVASSETQRALRS